MPENQIASVAPKHSVAGMRRTPGGVVRRVNFDRDPYGRTVYNPSFSGVYWDAQDLVVEDIDRIEVIGALGRLRIRRPTFS